MSSSRSSAEAARGEPDEVDVLVIGAGPAGLTLAGLLKKHRPATRVRVLERARLPQHKIGESLLLDVNRILADLGALDAVEAAGFSQKHGVTFLWGPRRAIHTFLWREGKAAVAPPSGYQLDYTWHVDRHRYDQILAEAARAHGAEVLEGHAVTEVLREGERVVGVRAEADGEVSEVRARWVIDCGSRAGPLARRDSERALDEQLRNVAVYGYLEGLGFDDALNGSEDARRTLVVTHPRGWLWVIPLAGGRASVGFVTSVEQLRADAPEDLERYYREALAEIPEHDALFGRARLVDYRGDGRLVRSVQEYSYQCARLYGPGWALCGDASGFVDAILSIGCFVAHSHAQFLACALASVLDGADEALALESYATSVRENLAAFRAVAHMFYAFNDTATDFWRACSAQLRASTLVPDARDREAALAFFSGFGARSGVYEEAVGSLGGSFLSDVGQQLFGDEALFRDDVVGAEAARARALVRGDARLVLAPGVRTRDFLLPRVSAGRLAQATRVELEADAGTRHLHVPVALAGALPLFDGSRTVTEVGDALAPADAGRGDAGRRGPLHAEAMKLAYRLLCMGALREAGAR